MGSGVGRGRVDQDLKLGRWVIGAAHACRGFGENGYHEGHLRGERAVGQEFRASFQTSAS